MPNLAPAIPVAEACRQLEVTEPVFRRLATHPRHPLPIFSRDGEEMVTKRALRDYLERRVEPHYSVQSAARLLDVCDHTVRRWIRAGKLEQRVIAGSYRIPESSILAALTPAP